MTHQFGSATVSELEFFIRAIIAQDVRGWDKAKMDLSLYSRYSLQPWRGRATLEEQPDPTSICCICLEIGAQVASPQSPILRSS